MKKYLLFTAISFFALVTACKKNQDDPTPVTHVSDSVKFIMAKTSGDTVFMYSSVKKGTFSVSYQAFENNSSITGQNLTIQLEALDQAGTFKFNNTVVTSQQIAEGSIVDFDYYPINVKGSQRVVVKTTTSNGKTFSDTLSFYVKTYLPVPYTVSFNSKNFPNQTTTSNFTFTMSINSGDLTNSTNYFYKINGLLIGPAGYTGTTLIKDNNHSTFIGVGQEVAFTTGTVESVTVSLSVMSPGNYKIPLKIFDQNGDFKLDTVKYTVQ